MEGDAFYGDFMVKLMWRFHGNFISHVFSITLQTNYITSAYYKDNNVAFDLFTETHLCNQSPSDIIFFRCSGVNHWTEAI